MKTTIKIEGLDDRIYPGMFATVTEEYGVWITDARGGIVDEFEVGEWDAVIVEAEDI